MSSSPGEVSGVATTVERHLRPLSPAHRVSAKLTERPRRTHLSAASDVAAVVADPVRRIGAQDVVLYLIAYEQRTLVPHPVSAARSRAALGRAGRRSDLPE
jgi:hypothetical protein